jgi:hypothetical protein
MTPVCYICNEEFKDNDLTVPININAVLPYGRISVTVLNHYLCGLDYFLNILKEVDVLMDKDRMAIESKLMDALNSMHRGNIQ